jgi:UDP-glucose 4-epimerase
VIAACSGRDSPVRKLVLKSSAHFYGSEQDDPAFFTEAMDRPHAPRTPIERDLVEAEAAVSEYAERNPGVTVTMLRFSNVLGPDVTTSHTRLFALPAVPMVLGFDPRCQFVHEDDVVEALAHAVAHDLPGVYNVAADGVLALSEVIALLGKRSAPVLPPVGTRLALTALGPLGLRVPPEMVHQLLYGRGLDNRLFKATGFSYRYTTREAVADFADRMRLAPILRGAAEPFHFEQEVEDFLSRSPNVRRLGPAESGLSAEEVSELRGLLGDRAGNGGDPDEGSRASARARGERYEDLEAHEIVFLLGSLETADLAALGEHERAHRARPEVLKAIDAALERRAREREPSPAARSARRGEPPGPPGGEPVTPS